MGFTVRIAVAGDYEAVAKIMYQVQKLHVDWRPDIYQDNPYFFDEDYYSFFLDKGSMYVAETEGKVVGVLGIDRRHIENPAQVTRDVIFIDSMAVDAEYRGKGIGHLFFDKVKAIKEEEGLDGIELQVNARNAAAREMYRKCGFTEKSINMELL